MRLVGNLLQRHVLTYVHFISPQKHFLRYTIYPVAFATNNEYIETCTRKSVNYPIHILYLNRTKGLCYKLHGRMVLIIIYCKRVCYFSKVRDSGSSV